MRVHAHLLPAVVIATLFTGVQPAWSATPSLKGAVLTLRDLPAGFMLFNKGYVPPSLASTYADGTSAQLKAWGYENGYAGDFKRDVTKFKKGVMDIQSVVTLYRSAAGANAAFRFAAVQCRTPPAKELSLNVRIGDESDLCSKVSRAGGFHTQLYILVWRQADLKAEVQIAGPQGTLSASEAVVLAERQEQAMRRMH